MGSSIACNQKHMCELMIWEYSPPTDPLDQEDCKMGLRTIDQFLLSATGIYGCDVPGALIECYRGWNIPFGEPSRELFSLFWWTSNEDEARFKDPREPSSLQGWSSPDDNHYEERFVGVVRGMQQKKWLYDKEHIHFRLAIWGTRQ